MIDQDKMRALVAKLRGPLNKFDNWAAAYSECADAIDLLLAEVEAANMQLTVPDWAEGDDQAWDKVTPAVAWHLIERHGENWAHIGRMMQAYLDAHTATLRVELEASDQKRKEAILDAEKARDERNRAHVKLNAEWIEKTNALRAELQAAAADKRDEPTLEMIRAGLCVVYPALYKESLFSEFDGPILRAATERRIGIMREQYKAMVDAALAQRQGEGS